MNTHSPIPDPGTALPSPLCLGKGFTPLGLLPGGKNHCSAGCLSPGMPLRPQPPCCPCSAAVPAAFPSRARARSKARGCGWQPSPCSRMAVEQLQGWGCSKDSTRRGGHQVSVFPSRRGQWDAEGPRGARPAGSPTGFLEERDRRGEPERQFPEPVFALAAPASVPHSPDAQLLGGIAASLKPGLAAGLLSGWGQGSSQGLRGGQCPHTAFLPRCCQAELSCSGSPGWGNNVTCSLTSVH